MFYQQGTRVGGIDLQHERELGADSTKLSARKVLLRPRGRKRSERESGTGVRGTDAVVSRLENGLRSGRGAS